MRGRRSGSVRIMVRLGGMRRPRKSVRRLPYHRRVGVRVSDALGRHLDAHPGLEQALHDTIGDQSKSKGPSQEDVLKAVKVVDGILDIRRSGQEHQGRTQLDHAR